MAWSDEARRAAAEARRLHARVKVEQQGVKGWPVEYNKGIRTRLAKKLRGIRSGTGVKTPERQVRAMVIAVRSTNMRNFIKKGGKIW